MPKEVCVCNEYFGHHSQCDHFEILKSILWSSNLLLPQDLENECDLRMEKRLSFKQEREAKRGRKEKRKKRKEEEKKRRRKEKRKKRKEEEKKRGRKEKRKKRKEEEKKRGRKEKRKKRKEEKKRRKEKKKRKEEEKKKKRRRKEKRKKKRKKKKPVLIPTSAPRPKRYPSAKREDAFQNTHAESTLCKKRCAFSSFCVMMTSVCALPCV
jgi:hypothetical protein